MTRAEEKALEAYPVNHIEKKLLNGVTVGADMNTEFREGYMIGYNQAEKDNGWISVEESLPPMGEEVIVLTNEMNGHNLLDASHLCFAHRPDLEVAVCYDGWNIPGVRYWMYCPELPEE